MTLKELIMKVLALIEELNPESELLTEDPDIATKIKDVINQVQFELARIKKIPKYLEMEVSEGDVVTWEDIETELGYSVFQLEKVSGVRWNPRARGTVLKFLESGTAEIECFVYPERITDKTTYSYEFELSQDVLEVMPYGVAADLLKSDVSSEYGSVYATRYESMLQRIDPNYHTPMISVEGGVVI